MPLAGLGRLGDHSGCGKVGIQCAADVLFVGRQEQVGVQSLKVAVGVAPTGKHAALKLQARMLGRPEDAQT